MHPHATRPGRARATGVIIETVTDSHPDAARVAARAALGRLAAFGAAGGVLSALGAAGIGVPCPWRLLTGTLCPLCGATHLGVRLLHLDIPGAFAANPFVFAALLVLAGLGVTTVQPLPDEMGGAGMSVSESCSETGLMGCSSAWC